MKSMTNLGVATALGVGIGLAMGVAFHKAATGIAIGTRVGIAAVALTLLNGARRGKTSC